MRVVAATLAALVLAPAAISAAAPAGLASGLRGIVMRGPTKPVCTETEPCEEPAAGVVLRFARLGRVVARVRTSAAGAYRVTLRPGRYSVTTPQRGVGAGLTPRVVRVPAGRIARVDFHLDTGIQ
jgi:hypothetical protein